MAENKKAILAIRELLSRGEYEVVQGNDLAKAFGGLSAFEQRLLDYCFSFVKADSKTTDIYETTALDIIKHFGLNASGQNYERIAQGFKRLNENTAIYLPTVDQRGVKGILMTQLFSGIEFKENGVISFEFSTKVAPLVFDLKKNFYHFKLRELSQIRGKYALILLKLWESYRRGEEVTTTITGSLEEWESWCLNKDDQWSAGRFLKDVLNRGFDELEKKLPIDVTITSLKKGRKVAGYEVQITDTTRLVN